MLSQEMHRHSPGIAFYIQWRPNTWKKKPRRSNPWSADLCTWPNGLPFGLEAAGMVLRSVMGEWALLEMVC